MMVMSYHLRMYLLEQFESHLNIEWLEEQKREKIKQSNDGSIFVIRHNKAIVGVLSTSNPHVAILELDPQIKDQSFLSNIPFTQEAQMLVVESRGQLQPPSQLLPNWSLIDVSCMYKTDLNQPLPQWKTDAQVQEITPEQLKQQQELLVVLERVNEPENTEGKRYFLQVSDGQAIALAALITTPYNVMIDLIGVHPKHRKQGYGRRLHAHMLSVASKEHQIHRGGTEKDNIAMNKIYQANGSIKLSEQAQYVRLP